ncbi:hypothetical protein [Streptomyces fuscichromogenes]|uniref:DUF732 domain-containing protein n=1 Tax=Streptomyces fuscichromogenes TaxID=1324013 RepID=A0A917XPP7_9ACTN|nr:hypothetical protein [Streptomyces fuscichromogenes]GGN47536.1 hypothetical protein GCM10011578_101160 [Streptomyces fuscichromogenes]
MSNQPHPQYPQQAPGWGPPPPARTQKKNGPKIAAIGCGGVLALVVVAGIIGVATGSDDDAKDKPKASTSATLTDEQRASAAAAAGIPPQPKAATRTAYLAALTAINPDIVHGKPDTVVDRGLNQCSSYKTTSDRDQLLKLTNLRFTSPDHPEGFGLTTAAKILDVVHKRLCPDY